jgi:hypothetical protein
MKGIVFKGFASLLLIFQIPPVANANCSDAIERVSICDLVQMPERYEGKLGACPRIS